MVWLAVVGAPAFAVKAMVPLLPLPGLVTTAVTPLGKVPTPSVTFPVKFVRVTVTVMFCELPPGTRVREEGLTLLTLIEPGISMATSFPPA